VPLVLVAVAFLLAAMHRASPAAVPEVQEEQGQPELGSVGVPVAGGAGSAGGANLVKLAQSGLGFLELGQKLAGTGAALASGVSAAASSVSSALSSVGLAGAGGAAAAAAGVAVIAGLGVLFGMSVAGMFAEYSPEPQRRATLNNVMGYMAVSSYLRPSMPGHPIVTSADDAAQVQAAGAWMQEAGHRIRSAVSAANLGELASRAVFNQILFGGAPTKGVRESVVLQREK
jgi:hypothetical protein